MTPYSAKQLHHKLRYLLKFKSCIPIFQFSDISSGSSPTQFSCLYSTQAKIEVSWKSWKLGTRTHRLSSLCNSGKYTKALLKVYITLSSGLLTCDNLSMRWYSKIRWNTLSEVPEYTLKNSPSPVLRICLFFKQSDKTQRKREIHKRIW